MERNIRREDAAPASLLPLFGFLLRRRRLLLVRVPEEITLSMSGPPVLAEMGVDDISGGARSWRVGGQIIYLERYPPFCSVPTMWSG